MKHDTVSNLKKNAENFDVSEPTVITKNGEPAYVIESHEDFVKRQELLYWLKIELIGEPRQPGDEGMSKAEMVESLRIY